MPAQTGLKDVSSVTDVTVAASPIFGPVTCDTSPTLFRGIERKRKKEFCKNKTEKPGAL